MLCGGETPAEEEEETDRPDHDRRTDEFCAPDAHWLWGDGGRRRPCHDRCCSGTDEIQGEPREAMEQFSGLIASSGMVLQSPASILSSPEDASLTGLIALRTVNPQPYFSHCLIVPQKSWGAGLPFLRLAGALPGDGFKSAGLTV